MQSGVCEGKRVKGRTNEPMIQHASQCGPERRGASVLTCVVLSQPSEQWTKTERRREWIASAIYSLPPDSSTSAFTAINRNHLHGPIPTIRAVD